jgi:hypothetical protein
MAGDEGTSTSQVQGGAKERTRIVLFSASAAVLPDAYLKLSICTAALPRLDTIDHVPTSHQASSARRRPSALFSRFSPHLS